MAEVKLSPLEARVIAALVEKSLTTPQYYPMSVNAIMLAANQKTSRHPVMNLTEGDTGGALLRFEEMKWCSRDPLSGRVTKWRQGFQHQLLLKPPVQALLVTLMLRGPQTLSELRANAQVLGGPGDSESMAAALQDLGDRAQPLTVLLPRAPGQKEARYAHTLCGVPENASVASAEDLLPAPASHSANLEERVRKLEERLAEMEAKLAPLMQ